MKLPSVFTTVTPISNFFAIILFVSLPFIGFYLGSKYSSSTCPASTTTFIEKQNPTVIEKQNPTVTETSSPLLSEGVKSEIENIFNDVLSSRITYDQKKGDVNYFFEQVNFAPDDNNKWRNLMINAYLYERGNSRFMVAYEGSEWERNLDQEVDLFLSLEPGKQIVNVYDSIGNDKAIVNYRKIGNRFYAIYDTYFKPGGNFNRHYISYDPSLSQLVYIVFSYANYDKGHGVSFDYNEEGHYFENIVYPPDGQRYLRAIESTLAKF